MRNFFSFFEKKYCWGKIFQNFKKCFFSSSKQYYRCDYTLGFSTVGFMYHFHENLVGPYFCVWGLDQLSDPLPRRHFSYSPRKYFDRVFHESAIPDDFQTAPVLKGYELLNDLITPRTRKQLKRPTIKLFQQVVKPDFIQIIPFFRNSFVLEKFTRDFGRFFF